MEIDAPKQGRPLTRVNWLIRQLRAAPDGLRVEAYVAHSRGSSTAELLHRVREDANVLIADPKRELRSFRLAVTSPMGSKRGRGRGAFIDSVLDAVDAFYGDVLQHLKAWSAAPPKLRETPEAPKDVRPTLSSTALSSQDEVAEQPDAAGDQQPPFVSGATFEGAAPPSSSAAATTASQIQDEGNAPAAESEHYQSSSA